MEALRDAGPRPRSRVEAVDAGAPVPRHLHRHADALRGLGGEPRASPGLGVLPGTVRRLPERREAPADAVERARRVGEPRRCSPAWPTRPWVYFVHSYAAEADRRRRRHVRLRRPGRGRGRARATCGPRSSTPRSRAPTGLRSSRNFVDAVARRPDGPLPGHRPAGRPVRAPAPGRLRPGDRLRRRPGRRGHAASPTPARRGSTWSTSTRPAPASRVNRAGRSRPSPRRSTCPVQTGGGVRDEAAAERCSTAGVARVVARHRGASSDPSCVRRPGRGAARPGRRRARRPGRRGRACGAGRRAAGVQLLDVAARGSRTPAWPRSSSPRSSGDGTLDGPDLDGLRRRSRSSRSVAGRSRRGGVGSLDDLRAARATLAASTRRHRRQGALRGPRSRSSEAVAGVRERDPGHPVPRRRRGPGREGRQLRRPARRRRPGRAGGPLRRARAPTSSSSSTSPRRRDARETMVDVVAPHRRAGVHPAHRRRRRPRRSTTPAGCCGPAPTRCRVNTAAVDRPELDRRAGRRVRRPVRGRRHRRPPARRRRRLRGVHPRRAHARPGSTPSTWAAEAERLGARARSCSRRWTATAPRTASTSSSPRAVGDAVGVPVIASGGRRARSTTWSRASSTGGADAVLAASIFHFGEHTVGRGQGRDGRRGHHRSGRSDRRAVPTLGEPSRETVAERPRGRRASCRSRC